MRKTSPLVAAVALLAPLTFADAPPAAPPAPAPAAAPPTSPVEGEVPALVAKLGDDSPKVREDASQKLRQLGAAAVPALTEAQTSADPEVATRAQAILRGIDEDRRPKASRDPGRDPGVGYNKLRLQRHAADVVARPGVAAKAVSVARNADGTTTRVTTVNDGDQRVTIREDTAGVAVTTTKTVDGKDVESTVKAKDRAALKAEHPGAFALVEKHTRQVVQVRGAMGGGAAFEFDHLNPADRGQVDAAVGEARKLAEELRRNLEADGLIDARTQLELQRALDQARQNADQHRKVMEEQMRAARQQLEAAKRQHQQQVEEIKRQQREQGESGRRID
jgi:hypothetical protein